MYQEGEFSRLEHEGGFYSVDGLLLVAHRKEPEQIRLVDLGEDVPDATFADVLRMADDERAMHKEKHAGWLALQRDA